MNIDDREFQIKRETLGFCILLLKIVCDRDDVCPQEKYRDKVQCLIPVFFLRRIVSVCSNTHCIWRWRTVFFPNKFIKQIKQRVIF